MGDNARVLMVDDEVEVLASARRALRKLPFQLDTSTSPREALRMIDETPYDVIVSDESMTEMSGCAFLTRVAKRLPASIRIVVTGQATLEAAQRAINDAGVFRFLTKPFPTGMLGQIIQEGLAQCHARRQVVEALEARIEFDSTHDTLTELPNEEAFQRALSEALDEFDAPSATVLVLVVGIDRMKRINEAFGRAAGDAVLRTIGQRLRTLRASPESKDLFTAPDPNGTGDLSPIETGASTVARLGPDEFALLVLGPGSLRNGRRIARYATSVFRTPVVTRAGEIHVSGRLGAAHGRSGKATAETLLSDARIALDVAKGVTAQERIALFQEHMRGDVRSRLELERDLRRAIDNNELLAFFQPIVEAGDRHVVGFEALLRWFHPERGLVYPVEIIKVAEETGLIVPIGEWILREACSAQVGWRAAGFDVKVSVNLSPRQFESPRLLDRVREILDETEVNPQRVQLELTESTLIADEQRADATVASLLSLGVQLALDDFGSGYSSISYLQRFSFHTLKVDRSLAQCIDQSGKDRAVLRCIIDLARALGLRVVVEGVESEPQAQVLHRLGAQELQGFLFSRPVTAARVLDLLRAVSGRPGRWRGARNDVPPVDPQLDLTPGPFEPIL